MKVAIVGYATEGQVSAEYWLRRGHDVTVRDQNANLAVPKDFSAQLGNGYLKDLDSFDIVVRSAGIHPKILLKDNPSIASKITTAVDEFLKNCPSKNVIGITGTKGKGTTSTLTAKMLEAAGRRTHLGGNIGRSPLEFIDDVEPSDFVVLELSSFQLADIKHSPHIAACLMIAPEHLNWHSDMEDYMSAKQNLFINQTDQDYAIYFSESADSKTVASAGKAQKIPFFASPGAHIEAKNVVIDDQIICPTNEIGLLGAFNWQNVCAAVTVVWQAGVQDIAAIKSVLTSFKGLEHRLEYVRTVNKVDYFDDSFGTTPETAIVAIESFAEPKVVILGGSDKGVGFASLAEAVAENNVRHAVIIGDVADKIKQALDEIGFTKYTLGLTAMPDIVKAARSRAKPGDVVLLSTGCASFGLFRDYKDRAKQFRDAVEQL